MSTRQMVVSAANRVLNRAGVALVRSEDVGVLQWVADEAFVIPLPETPVADEVACLRPLVLADAAVMAAAAADPDVIHFAMWPTPFTEVHARRWIAKAEAGRRAGQFFCLALLDAGTRRFCGILGAYRMDRNRQAAEQFLWLGPEARGKGLAIRATLLLDRWIFEHTCISRMEATTLAENEPARRSLGRTGYTEEGVLRGGLVHYQQRHDAVLFSLLRSDLEDDETGALTCTPFAYDHTNAPA